jgi:hypothetical protein
MYRTVITVNSLCSKVTFDFDKDDCELEEKLNLNKRNDNNLEKNEENPKDLIRKAILPICIVEHTDTNIIFSITCPETLSKNFRDDILRAFSNIKPCSIKGFDLDKEYADTRKEEKNDKIYINSFDNICSNPNIDPSKTMICNLTKNVITDKEGNVISSKISNVTKTIIDENNFSLNNFTYEFKNIPKENSDSFDETIYKTNLDSIFSLTKEIMKNATPMRIIRGSDNLLRFSSNFAKQVQQGTHAKGKNPGAMPAAFGMRRSFPQSQQLAVSVSQSIMR